MLLPVREHVLWAMAQALASLRDQLQAKRNRIGGWSPEFIMREAATAGHHAAMALTYCSMQHRLAGTGVESLSQAIADVLHSLSASNDGALKRETPAGVLPNLDPGDSQVMHVPGVPVLLIGLMGFCLWEKWSVGLSGPGPNQFSFLTGLLQWAAASDAILLNPCVTAMICPSTYTCHVYMSVCVYMPRIYVRIRIHATYI